LGGNSKERQHAEGHACHRSRRGPVGGTQLQVSGSNEAFQLKAVSPLQQQVNASTGKTVTLDGILTPNKDVKAAVPLEIQAVRP